MSEVKVINIKDVTGERRDPPRTSWILVSEKTVGAKNLAMGVNETDPGGMVPEHKHDKEEEVMFFLCRPGDLRHRGRGDSLGAGGVHLQSTRGNAQDREHGDEVLKFVWIYSPQLPQHRVRNNRRMERRT